MLRYIAAACLMASPLTAHEFRSLEIVQVRESNFSYKLLIPDTEGGHTINCVGYDQAGVPVLVNKAVTDNLATQVLLVRNGIDAVSFACVFED